MYCAGVTDRITSCVRQSIALADVLSRSYSSVSHPMYVKALHWLMYCAGPTALYDMALFLRYISLRPTREGGGEVQNTLQ